ncbi:MAG: hypothetical protein Q4F69_02340 [Bacteroidia bacterium]|nr:hypothetical protein [Bacteroidia bacterium]
MKKILRILGVAFIMSGLFASCNSRPENPYEPDIDINFTINPNSMEYFDLNIVSGWMYVMSRYPSRGIIIYRYSQDEFRAYERMPPNDPNACGEENRLYVDPPFVIDSCLGYKYSILDGGLIEGGPGYNLIQYYTQYDGTMLRVYN